MYSVRHALLHVEVLDLTNKKAVVQVVGLLHGQQGGVLILHVRILNQSGPLMTETRLMFNEQVGMKVCAKGKIVERAKDGREGGFNVYFSTSQKSHL